MLRRLAVVLALCLGTSIISGPLHALGLGAIRVQSGLNQPFSATIPFTALSPQEAESLRVKIADNADFARAGIERSAYLSSVKIEAVTGNGAPRLVIRGAQIVREPLLTLLIDVRAGGPKVLREYTVFLDPPGTVPPLPELLAEPLPLPSDDEVAVADAAPPSTTGESVPEDASTSQPPGEYGPIEPGDSLWRIAEQVRPDDRRITIEQVMLALYKANPQAFPQGSIRSMVLNSTLRVPDPGEMSSTPHATAKAEIAKLSAPPRPQAPDGESTPPSVQSARVEEPVSVPSPTPEPVPAATELDSGDPDDGAAPVVPAAALPLPESAPPPVRGEKPPGSSKTPESAARAGGSLLRALLPALIILIVLLIAFLLLRSRRQRKAQAEYEAAATAMASSSLAASIAPVPRARKSAREELEEVNRRLADEDDESGAGSTARIKPGSAGRSEGADPTSQFEASTFEINLSDNDPISEAEFHLAYGLYDEAALLLKRAAASNPDRTELRVKLAETYFAAGKPVEFQAVAESLVGQLEPPSWEKLAIMGRQLCPDVELFKGEAGGSAMSVDVALGDNSGGDAGAPSARIDDGLDFRLEELELPGRPDSGAAGGAGSTSTNFDFGQFDLGGASDLGGARVGAAETSLGQAPQTPPSADELEIRLEDIAVDTEIDDPFGDGSISAVDDVGTKLDLARAYVEMGDLEMARSLLDEVDAEGSDDQKREAVLLRERMLG